MKCILIIVFVLFWHFGYTQNSFELKFEPGKAVLTSESEKLLNTEIDKLYIAANVKLTVNYKRSVNSYEGQELAESRMELLKKLLNEESIREDKLQFQLSQSVFQDVATITYIPADYSEDALKRGDTVFVTPSGYRILSKVDVMNHLAFAPIRNVTDSVMNSGIKNQNVKSETLIPSGMYDVRYDYTKVDTFQLYLPVEQNLTGMKPAVYALQRNKIYWQRVPFRFVKIGKKQFCLVTVGYPTLFSVQYNLSKNGRDVIVKAPEGMAFTKAVLRFEAPDIPILAKISDDQTTATFEIVDAFTWKSVDIETTDASLYTYKLQAEPLIREIMKKVEKADPAESIKVEIRPEYLVSPGLITVVKPK